MTWRRVGGHGLGPDGADVTWSAAEGRRGIRWRETVGGPDGLRHVLLLEVAPTGRPTRLEMASPEGMLTVHPEPDDSALHGNVVTADGIVHVTLPWGPAHQLLVPGSPTALSAVLSIVAPSIADGGATEWAAIVIDADLRPRATRWRGQRVGGGEWRIGEVGDAGPGTTSSWRQVNTAPDGGPALAHATSWPLER